MTDNLVIIISLLMLFHLAIGVPLFLVLGLGSLAMISVAGVYSIEVIGQVPFASIDNWALLAMPLFILTGDIVSNGRIAQQLVNLGKAMLGWLPGGLGMTTIGGCFFFGGTSGSNSADTAAIGKIMIPSMVENGYSRTYSAALAAAGGCLGIIVPPSLIFIIYGVITATSVGDLFLAGIVPGILMAASLCIANYILCRWFSWGPTTNDKFSGKVLVKASWNAKWGILAPCIILGGIYSGLFTPTESAAVAVAYCLFIELLVTRGVKIKDVPMLFQRSGAITGIIGPIIAFSILFGEALSVLRVPNRVAEYLLSMASGEISTILIMALVLFIAGCFLETIAAIVILMPIMIPIAHAIDFNMVHLGVFVVCALTVGFITPPVGINLFAASAVSGVPYTKIALKAWPLCVALMAIVLLIGFIPSISIWFLA